MPATKLTDAETLMALLRDALAAGCNPKSISVGAVELVIHSVERATGDRRQAPTDTEQPLGSSYLERALRENARDRAKRERGEAK